MKFRFILLITIVNLSCVDKEVFHDERLVSYALNIKEELIKNGVSIDLNNVSLIIKDGLSDNGSWGLSKGDVIYIDENIFNRKTKGSISGHIQIEMLLLHEIGHNLLGLKHWETNKLWPYDGYQIMETGTWQKISNEERKSLAYKNIVLYFNMR